jgi:hypothetical protein
MRAYYSVKADEIVVRHGFFYDDGAGIWFLKADERLDLSTMVYLGRL